MSIFKKFQSRRADRKNRARLQELSKAFATFDNFVQSNLLYWDPRNRRLFIAEPLAIVYIGQGLKAWRNFLNNVFLWETNKLQQHQWQEGFEKSLSLHHSVFVLFLYLTQKTKKV